MTKQVPFSYKVSVRDKVVSVRLFCRHMQRYIFDGEDRRSCSNCLFQPKYGGIPWNGRISKWC